MQNVLMWAVLCKLRIMAVVAMTTCRLHEQLLLLLGQLWTPKGHYLIIVIADAIFRQRKESLQFRSMEQQQNRCPWFLRWRAAAAAAAAEDCTESDPEQRDSTHCVCVWESEQKSVLSLFLFVWGSRSSYTFFSRSWRHIFRRCD